MPLQGIVAKREALSFLPGIESNSWSSGVVAVRASPEIDSTYLFRTYDAPRNQDVPEDYPLNPGSADDCQIWQAARPTSAAPLYFPPVKIEGDVFLDGGIGTNNPARMTLSEVSRASPAHSRVVTRTCLVSIGAGARPPVPRIQGISKSVGIFHYALDSLTKTLSTHRDVANIAGAIGLAYFRFTVPVLDINIDEWWARKGSTGQTLSTIGFIRQETSTYLEEPAVAESIHRCTELLVINLQSQR